MFCPVCGSKNPDDGATCGTCGADLRASAAGLQKKAPMQPVSAKPASRPKMGTMLGVAQPAAGSQAPPQALHAPISQQQPQPPPGSRPAPVSVGGAPQQQPNSRPKMGTMLGVAMPAPGSQAPPQPAMPPSVGAPGPVSVGQPSQQRPPVSVGGAPAPTSGARKYGTMLGVAMPAAGSVAPPNQQPPPMQPGAVTGQSAMRSDDRPQASPRTILARALVARGPNLSEDVAQVEALLLEDYRRNVGLIVTAQRANVPGQLRIAAKGEGVLAASVRLVAQLQAQGMSQEDARYAVDTWAVALGL